jgi:hypothetical protein
LLDLTGYFKGVSSGYFKQPTIFNKGAKLLSEAIHKLSGGYIKLRVDVSHNLRKRRWGRI